MKKIDTFLRNNLGSLILFILLIILSIVIIRSYKKPLSDKALDAVETKLDSIHNSLQIERNNKIDTLIIQQNHEKEIIKKLQDINNYYTEKDNGIDTIVILDSSVRSPFAAEKLKEWKLRSDTGYYDIFK